MTAKTPEEEAESYLKEFTEYPHLAFTPSALKHFRALLERITTLKRERDDAYRRGADDQREKIANCFDDRGQERPPPFLEDLYGEVMSMPLSLPTPEPEGE